MIDASRTALTAMKEANTALEGGDQGFAQSVERSKRSSAAFTPRSRRN